MRTNKEPSILLLSILCLLIGLNRPANKVFVNATQTSQPNHTMAASASNQSLYFGYGSNLWLQQMAMRCPDSTYIGTAALHNWRWIICKRGYANLVPSKGDIVYGLVYKLTKEDEEKLDVNEGVSGGAYSKKQLSVLLFAEERGENDSNEGRIIEGLVYVNDLMVEESTPNEEYVHRMNIGINDATRMGVPQWYIDLFLRPFIRHEQLSTTKKKVQPRVVQSHTKRHNYPTVEDE